MIDRGTTVELNGYFLLKWNNHNNQKETHLLSKLSWGLEGKNGKKPATEFV